ncbi:MAG: cytidine deaminase family protein, partial [Flammeovirgaceae bacterium]
MKDFEVYSSLEELDAESKYLVHKAKDATANAYAPYSKFHVGAAVILEDDTVVIGANQENAAYPLCMCADRVALYAAISAHPEKKIPTLAEIGRASWRERV